jgi:hypothetical protein
MSITPSLADNSAINLPSWLQAVNRFARTLFAEYDPYGLLFLVADNVVWQALPANQITDPAGNPAIRARPTFPTPPDLALNAGPAARDIHKHQLRSSMTYLSTLVTLTTALIDSIGESNRVAISHPIYETTLLTPTDIVNQMTTMHSNYTQLDIDVLREPLSVKLSNLTEFRPHVATFRQALAALNRAGQLPLPLEQYSMFRNSLSTYPQFFTYITSYTIARPQIAQQTFETLAAFLDPQLHNIISAATPNPFAGAIQPPPPPLTKIPTILEGEREEGEEARVVVEVPEEGDVKEEIEKGEGVARHKDHPQHLLQTPNHPLLTCPAVLQTAHLPPTTTASTMDGLQPMVGPPLVHTRETLAA